MPSDATIALACAVFALLALAGALGGLALRDRRDARAIAAELDRQREEEG